MDQHFVAGFASGLTKQAISQKMMMEGILSRQLRSFQPIFDDTVRKAIRDTSAAQASQLPQMSRSAQKTWIGGVKKHFPKGKLMTEAETELASHRVHRDAAEMFMKEYKKKFPGA